MADPYKNNVVLYLPMEGSRHGDTVILDRTGKTVTRNGDVVLSTAVAPPFGTTSAYFDGTGDALYISNRPAFEYDDFTIELWFYISIAHNNTYRFFLDTRNGANTQDVGLMLWDTNILVAYLPSGGVYSSVVPTVSVWHHAAVCRKNGLVFLLLDGVVIATGNWTSQNMTGTYTGLGVNTYITGNYFAGYIKDVRITKGIARYTGNFYVDQKPFDCDLPEQPRIVI
jgi:hypothetical protein